MKIFCCCKSVVLIAFFIFQIDAITLFASEDDFSDVEFEEAFYPYLTAKKRFMTINGVQEFTSPDKRRVIVCITSTPSQGSSGSALAKMIKVCRIKAQVELLKSKGYELSAFTRVGDKIISQDDGVHKKIESLSTYLSVAEEKVNGIVRSWPVIGTWFSKDGKEFYLAVGVIISQ